MANMLPLRWFSFVVQLEMLLNSFALAKSVEIEGTQEVYEFSRNFTGVVFSPYVKNWDMVDGSIPSWKNYTMEDVHAMLNLTATKFRHLTTYSMGAGRLNETWTTGDAAGLVGVAAAELNAKYASAAAVGQDILPLLTLTLGMWHSSEAPLIRLEAENALEAANIANSIHAGTIWGIALSSWSWMNYYKNWKDTVKFLQEWRPIVHKQKHALKIGLRLDICDQIVQRRRPEVGIDNLSPTWEGTGQGGGKPLSDIQLIARNADFLHCILFPSANTVADGVDAAVRALGNQMLDIEKAFKVQNPNIVVTWETGWPSAGVSRFGSANTVRNLQRFWKAMDSWAELTSSRLYMYSAFDEPWRTNPRSQKEVTDPEGPNGAESHFGWWYLENNDDVYSFKEKVPEPVIIPEGELSSWQVALITIGILVPLILFLVWRLYRATVVIQILSRKDIKEFFEGVPGKSATDDKDGANITENVINLPYDHSYELEKSQFTINETEILGSGEFGTVYKGQVVGFDGFAAFKRPNKDISVSQLKNLLTEVKVMIYIGKHENVVTFLGAYTKKIREGMLYIALEYCELGSLQDFLRNIGKSLADENGGGVTTEYENIQEAPPSSAKDAKRTEAYANIEHATTAKIQIPFNDMIRWSSEIASGMEYLSGRKIIHADLATRNILLTRLGISKISDFGLSRRLYEYTQYVKSSQEPLPWRWMAIESLKSLTFSSASDVWSFGVLLWEIFSLGDLPFPGLSWDVSFVEQLEQGLRMNKPKYATAEMYSQMVACWNLSPAARPTFTDLKKFVTGIANVDYEGESTSSALHNDGHIKAAGIAEESLYANVENETML